MKTKIALLTLVVLLTGLNSVLAQVGIGTTTPDAAAVLELTSTTQGFLPPRMTAAQRDAIATPVQGLMVYCTNCGSNGEMQVYNGAAWVNLTGGTAASPYPENSVFCASGATAIVDVTNPTTGEIWMDRNLGANRAATDSTDAESYGSLFQWGRRADGHQCVNRYSGDGVTTSPNTALNATESTDTPNHGNFIITNYTGNDWRSSQNVNLWQGVNGINNPCPSGYRIPTEAELDAERLTWTSQNNSAGAFASPLKMPVAGARDRINGSLYDVGTYGYYWSSTVSSPNSRFLTFGSSSANMNFNFRARGYSVRCLKD